MPFKAHFLAVGCADCTIFEMGNDVVVIDCGYRRTGDSVSSPTNILKYLRDVIKKTYIDLLIISHPHHDHYLGMGSLIGQVTVGEFWGSPYDRPYGDPSLSVEDWEQYCELRRRLVPDQSGRFTCHKGVEKIFSGCVFQVLGPRKDINASDARECHDACLVMWVSTPANKFVICGDASDSELEFIRADWNLTSCTVVRASHHGSINGANLEFIKAASPRDTIISTKSGVYENVPSDTALQRYRAYSTKVFRTDIDGTCATPLTID